MVSRCLMKKRRAFGTGADRGHEKMVVDPILSLEMPVGREDIWA